MSLRIISGRLRGKKLQAVQGAATRPTADRVREALFNILALKVSNAIVLDLFAGTGALGIEALSRGARYAVFIDDNKAALLTMRKNIEACRLEPFSRIIRWDILGNLNCLRVAKPRFNLVFMDPPYDRAMILKTLHNLYISCALENGALIVIEHSLRETLPENIEGFQLLKRRKYGKTLISFMQQASPLPEPQNDL